MKKYLSNKNGQALVEFAIILAFVTFVGYIAKSGLMPAAGALFIPTEKVLAEIDHRRTYDVAQAIKEIESIATHYKQGNGANKQDYRRGMVRSGWVEGNAVDSQITELKRLYDEVGARQWSYLTGDGDNYYKCVSYQKTYQLANGKPDLKYAVHNTNQDAGMYIGDKGLYWTVQDLTESKMQLYNSYNEKHNFSKQLVLQYFYSSWTHKYYVIKSYVWLNQGDVGNRIALAGLHQLYYKPAGYFVEGCMEGFETLAEAKELFEKVRLENGGSVVFDPDNNGISELDVNAGAYVIDEDKKSFVPENKALTN